MLNFSRNSIIHSLNQISVAWYLYSKNSGCSIQHMEKYSTETENLNSIYALFTEVSNMSTADTCFCHKQTKISSTCENYLTTKHTAFCKSSNNRVCFFNWPSLFSLKKGKTNLWLWRSNLKDILYILYL